MTDKTARLFHDRTGRLRQGMIFVNLMPKNDLFYVDSNNSDIVYVILYVGSVISFQIGAMNYRLKGTDKK